jgi:chitin disaccharide deacetylase
VRRLIINSDDFGFSQDVNRGIIDTHQAGMLTATTLMANGDAFEHAVELSKAHPALSVGCHLVLVQGMSVAQPNLALPATIFDLIRRLTLGDLDPQQEIAAQIEKILAVGIQPLHLDCHKHTHLHPKVLKAVAWASQNYSIPWVRCPVDYSKPKASAKVPMSKRFIHQALRLRGRSMRQMLKESGCKVTDHFVGFQVTGRLSPEVVLKLLAALPDGVTEFMCHVGYCTEELRSKPTRLKLSREAEMRAFLDPAVKLFVGKNFKLINFAELAGFEA